jgi:type I restriction enzyme S subunit
MAATDCAGFTDRWNTEGPIVLVGRQGAHCGNVHIARSKCWVSEHALRCFPNRVYSTEFIRYALETLRLNRYSVSAAQPGLSTDNIKPLLIAFPPFEAQKRIAAFLDEKTAQIDGLIEKKRALLERLAEKRQATTTQAVTKGLHPATPMKDSGIDWLGQIPAHWEVKRLRFLLDGDTLNGLYKPKEQFDEDGIPFIQMGEAFRSVAFYGGTKDRVLATPREIGQWGLRFGDFLIARRSIVFDGSGKSVLIGDLPGNHLFESSMIRVRIRNTKFSEYLSYYFQSTICRALFLAITKQVTISGVDSQQIKDICVPCPPLEESHKISMFLQASEENTELVRRSVERSLELLSKYRSALITAAVTGQIEGLR